MPTIKPTKAYTKQAAVNAAIGADYLFPRDVIAGTLIGISTGWMSAAILEGKRDRRRSKREVSCQCR